MTAKDLVSVFNKNGMLASSRLICDAEYSRPSRDWVTGVFSNTLEEQLKKFDVSVYQPEKFDCDDFALFAMFLAKVMHAKTARGLGGLAFGELWYFSKILEGRHAINFAVVEDNQVLFYEPQGCREVHLLREEITSCYGLRV